MSGVIVRTAHQAALAVAVTGVVAAARHRSAGAKPRSAKPRAAKPVPRAPQRAAVPAQRRSELEELGLRVDDLVVAEHEAQDARLFEALGC